MTLYAVRSLPTVEGGHHSSDPRNLRLLKLVKNLLEDISQMPMFGINQDDFEAQLKILLDADAAAQAASSHRQLVLTNFVNWALHRKGKVIGAYLDDLICEFFA